MNSIILGLYISLACRVHSAAVGSQVATGSGYIPSGSDMGSGVGHSGAASAIKLSPGTTELYQRKQVGKMGEEIQSNLKDDQHKGFQSSDYRPMEGRKMLRNRRETEQLFQTTTTPVPDGFQTTTTTAPIQPSMARTTTDYTPEQLHEMKRKANGQKIGRDYYYSKQGQTFVAISKDWRDVSGFCGKIKVYDSVNENQLLYETPCCHCGPCLSEKDRTEAEKLLDVTVYGTAAVCMCCLYAYCKAKCCKD